MPHGDPGGDARGEFRTQVVAVEAVVGDEDDRRVGSGQVQQTLQHEVMHTVGARDNVTIHFEISLGDSLHLRRMIRHEEVADFVDRAVIHREEIPVRIGLEQMHRRIVRGKGLGQFAGQHPEAFVFVLIDLVRFGDEETDHLVRVDVMRADAQFVEFLVQFRRPIGAGRRRRPVGRRLVGAGWLHVAEHVRDHFARQVAFALRGEPADHVAAQPAFGEDLPHRAAAARGGRDRHDRFAARIHLGETRHAVVVGHLARGDRCPEHRRKLRFERGDVAARSRLDQPRHAGQMPRIDHRMHDLPIGGIPSDKEKAFAAHGRKEILTAGGATGVPHERDVDVP